MQCRFHFYMNEVTRFCERRDAVNEVTRFIDKMKEEGEEQDNRELTKYQSGTYTPKFNKYRKTCGVTTSEATDDGSYS